MLTEDKTEPRRYSPTLLTRIEVSGLIAWLLCEYRKELCGLRAANSAGLLVNADEQVLLLAL